MKTKLIAIFLIMSVFGHAQDTIFPMRINVGTTANDGTGDKVRVAFQKVNGNFADIYSSVISGPVNGTKYTQLRKAVKRAVIEPAMSSFYYYIKRFEVGLYSGGYYNYYMEIAAASSSPTASGSALGVHEFSSLTPLTGYKRVGFSYAISPGGISGNLIIDFDDLTLGTTYTCANFKEGGIFATMTGAAATGGGGGIDGDLAQMLPRISAAVDTINGSSSFYLVSNANHTIRLDSLYKFFGSCTIKMSDSVTGGSLARTVVKPLAGAKINDRDSLYFHAGHWVTIYPDASKFQAISDSCKY